MPAEFATKLLLTSGLVQLSFGVLLGWPMALFHSGMSRVGPFRHVRRLLQCHIDNMLMGIIQIALSLAIAGPWLLPVVLVMAGSWANPQMFMVQAIRVSQGELPQGLKIASVASFIVVTAGYLLLVPPAIVRLWSS